MNMMVVKIIGKQVGKQIARQAPKYAAKALLSIPCEVAVYFGSKAIIKVVESENREEVIVEA